METKDTSGDESLPYKQEVRGSSPRPPTTNPRKTNTFTTGWTRKRDAFLAKQAQRSPASAHLSPNSASPDLVEIRLTKGKVAIVDRCDFKKLSVFKWRAKLESGIWYAVAGHNGDIRMHRLVTDAAKGEIVDHRDGDGLHNWSGNLRICSNAQNTRNSKIYSRKVTSKRKGVTFDKRRGNWRAQIMMQGIKINLGNYLDEETAARIYDQNARKLFGDFARTNFAPEA